MLVIILLGLAAAGCTPGPLTDVTTVVGPGRYEVSFAGSGVTFGGILFRPASGSKPPPAIIVLHGWARPAGFRNKAMWRWRCQCVAGRPPADGTTAEGRSPTMSRKLQIGWQRFPALMAIP